MNEISNLLNKTIDFIVDRKLKKMNLTVIFKTIVDSVNSDGTYSIIYKKKKYNIKCGLGITLTKGQLVWVTIPNYVLKDMYISALR